MPRQNWNPPSDYTPAPTEFSLKHARRMLATLYGQDLEDHPIVGIGECDDGCSTTGALLEYGRLHLCRRCATQRRRALIRQAA